MGRLQRLALKLFAGVISCSVLAGGAWWFVHEVPGVGPALADAARWFLGDSAVTRLEDEVYAISDRIKRVRYRNQAPKAHWRMPEPAVASPSGIGREETARPTLERTQAPPSFRPVDVGPLYQEQAAPGDGVWMPADPDPTPGAPLSFKTLLHPDPKRSYAELFVVALDLERVQLHAMPGTLEPESSMPGAHDIPRPAMVPDAHRAALLAAFNGGFKSRHGHFGMGVAGVTLAKPRLKSCTIASYEDGSLRVGTYDELPERDRLVWFRQTPGCMVKNGQRHPHLPNSTSWGATLDGKTVIRRSALGLDASGRVLFVGISNSTTAEALALGMQHAGAHTVAQLDVNYSFPRFLFYRATAEGLDTLPLAEGFVYSQGQYVEHKSPRDFFYVTRKQ